MQVPTRQDALLRAAVATLALVAGMIAGPQLLAGAGPAAQRSPAARVVALVSTDDAGGTETIGTQPPRSPAIGRAADAGGLRSVVLAVVFLAAGVAFLPTRGRACRGNGEALAARAPVAWAGPGGRRAPPGAAAP
jgi:hypothetical protein